MLEAHVVERTCLAPLEVARQREEATDATAPSDLPHHRRTPTGDQGIQPPVFEEGTAPLADAQGVG